MLYVFSLGAGDDAPAGVTGAGRRAALGGEFGQRDTVTAVLLALISTAGGCEREARRYQELAAAANRETAVRVTALEPGQPQQQAEVKSPYQNNAWGMGEGKRL